MVMSIVEVLDQLAFATADLLADIEGLSDASARAPSRLPGWSRGHVLTHLARNAEGGIRLLGWARTGVPSYEYESIEARAAAIEAGAGRPASILIEDVRITADGFFKAAQLLPDDAWQSEVVWTSGHRTHADHVIRSRLAEVFIHHVDLDVGYGPSSWPVTFTGDILDIVVDGGEPSVDLVATDSGRQWHVGSGPPTDTLVATQAQLLAWFAGRSDGSDIIHNADKRLAHIHVWPGQPPPPGAG